MKSPHICGHQLSIISTRLHTDLHFVQGDYGVNINTKVEADSSDKFTMTCFHVTNNVMVHLTAS